MDDHKQVVAIFHMVGELSAVSVEIRHAGKSHFILEKGKPTLFNNLNLAKYTAIKNGATLGFISLDSTYDEFANDYAGKAKDHTNELMPTPLKS
jgi:hypothetical protein